MIKTNDQYLGKETCDSQAFQRATRKRFSARLAIGAPLTRRRPSITCLFAILSIGEEYLNPTRAIPSHYQRVP